MTCRKGREIRGILGRACQGEGRPTFAEVVQHEPRNLDTHRTGRESMSESREPDSRAEEERGEGVEGFEEHVAVILFER